MVAFLHLDFVYFYWFLLIFGGIGLAWCYLDFFERLPIWKSKGTWSALGFVGELTYKITKNEFLAYIVNTIVLIGIVSFYVLGIV